MSDETSEIPRDPIDRIDHESLEDEAVLTGKRRREKLPEMWTRVISMSNDNLQELKVYQIAPDLLLNQGYEKTRKRKGEPDWEIHFLVSDMVEKHPNIDLE